MTAAPRGSTREQGRSEYGVALFLGVVGLVVIASAALLPESRIARGPVGPEAVPLVVGGLLVVVSVVLAFVLSIGSWFLFARGLGIVLPPGLLDGIL